MRNWRWLTRVQGRPAGKYIFGPVSYKTWACSFTLIIDICILLLSEEDSLYLIEAVIEIPNFQLVFETVSILPSGSSHLYVNNASPEGWHQLARTGSASRKLRHLWLLILTLSWQF